MQLLQPRPLTPPERPRFVLFAFAFRPFFLGAAVLALVLVPLWLAIVSDRLNPPAGWIPVLWHAHEMIFGFGGAAVAGFLLTASANWTGLRTLHGPGLAALFLLWLASRAACWTGVLPPAGHALLDGAWWLFLTAAWLPPILRARNHRNLIFLPLLLALGAADVLTHLRVVGWDTGPRLGLFLLLSLTSVIGGRVIPFFTSRAVPQASPQRFRPIERTATALTLAAGCAWLWAPTPLAIALLYAAAVVQFARLAGWASRGIRSNPLLWILYVAYLWLPVGLVLLGGSLWGGFPTGNAIHALTAGTVATMILGLMSRVALGHTGRPLVAGRPVVLAYALICGAALLRVTPVFGASLAGLTLSGICWVGAWLLMTVVYAPILLRPRADGRPG